LDNINDSNQGCTYSIRSSHEREEELKKKTHVSLSINQRSVLINKCIPSLKVGEIITFFLSELYLSHYQVSFNQSMYINNIFFFFCIQLERETKKPEEVVMVVAVVDR